MGIIGKIIEYVNGAQVQSATKTKYKVIDVSEWQGKIDWAKVKSSGVVGAIIRYADGNYHDPNFDTNMKNAKANGLHIGAYIYSRAKTKQQAEQEAMRIFNASKKYSPDMPLYIDLEAKGFGKYADTVAIAYLTKMKALGGRGGVYANLNWWNNYLKKTAKNYSASPFWIAQYNTTMDYRPANRMGMWQYTSNGSIKGISGRVDMNECYIAYWGSTPKPAPKKKYTGTLPTLTIKKTNAEVLKDAITWAKWIAGDNDFHYGYGAHAHHNGCYFCGTQPSSKKKSGIKMWEHTYCCNPFVQACYAHGGCDKTMLKVCQKGSSYIDKHYKASKIFKALGKPSFSSLKAGDVFTHLNGHVSMYIGNGKLVEAANGDDNVRNSKKWNESIRIADAKSRYNAKGYGVKSVYRYVGSANFTAYIRHGEVGARVRHLQLFLAWYGIDLIADGIFGDATLKAVKKFQAEQKLTADGIVGAKTIEKIRTVAL